MLINRSDVICALLVRHTIRSMVCHFNFCVAGTEAHLLFQLPCRRTTLLPLPNVYTCSVQFGYMWLSFSRLHFTPSEQENPVVEDDE